MKERVFYVINLDKQRIGVLSLFLFALFFSIFFLGVSVGKGRTIEQKPGNQTTGDSVSQLGSVEGNQTLDKDSKTPSSEIESGTSNNSKVSGNPNLSANLTQQNNLQSNEIPMADVGNAKLYAESSTQKDEEEERKNIVDLTKSSESKQTKGRIEHKFKNLAPSPKRSTQTSVSKAVSSSSNSVGNLYTIQLGAFATKASAEKFLTQVNLDNKNLTKLKAFIIVKNGYFVVQIGKTSNKDSLTKQLSKLKLSKEVKSKALIVGYSPLT